MNYKAIAGYPFLKEPSFSRDHKECNLLVLAAKFSCHLEVSCSKTSCFDDMKSGSVD